MDLLSFYLGTRYSKLKKDQRTGFLLTWLVIPMVLSTGIISLLLKDIVLGIVVGLVLTFVLGRIRR